ncbi:hypothetical protein D9M69_731140 [compost metagenome]
MVIHPVDDAKRFGQQADLVQPAGGSRKPKVIERIFKYLVHTVRINSKGVI